MIDHMVLGQEFGESIGLTTRAHVVVGLVTLCALAFIIRLLRRGQLRSKYAVLWVAAIVPLGLLAVWPGLLTWVSDRAGVFYPPTLFLLAAVAFLFLVVVHFSWELSRLEERSRTLAEQVAMLRADLDTVGLDAVGLDAVGLDAVDQHATFDAESGTHQTSDGMGTPAV